MALRSTGKELYAAVGHAVYCGCCPVGAVFTIGEALSKGGLAKLTASTTVVAPPNTSLHAILYAYDGFHYVVELIGCSMVPIGTHGLEEFGVVVKRTCELVGVTLVDIGAETIVPFQSFVAVEGVATADADVFEELIFLHKAAYLLEIGHGALIPIGIVGLVEGGDAHYIKPLVATIVDRSLEELDPLGRFAYVVFAVLRSFLLPLFSVVFAIA